MATGPARSWPSRPTTSATTPSPSRTACRSGASSRHAWRTRTPRWTRRSSRTPAARSSSTAGRTPGCPPTRVARRSSRELEARGKGTAAVTYRLHDWLISRQRYWGTPIPVIYCERDGIVPVPEEDLPVRLPDTVDYRGSGENPLNRDEAFLNVTVPGLRRPREARDRHDGHVHRLVLVLVSLPVTGEGRRADRSRPRRRVDPGRPVHRRRRARGHAPAVRPRVDEDDARRRPGRAGRAVQAAVQPGPDPRPRRRADVEVARQHRRSRRPGRPLRRGHGQAVPDVHGPVGPGRAVEPDRDRRRAPLPQPGLDPGHRSERPRAGRSRLRHPARRPDRDRRRDGDPVRGAQDPARRHRRLRDVPLQRDARQAHGAGEHAVPLPRHGRGELARPGTRRSACCC